MVHDQRSALSSYVAGLLARGQIVFTGREAEAALGVNRGAFLDAAERLLRRHSLVNPRQDFYLAVPPEFATWGAPPPPWYIDALMRHEGQPYYVGLLKAAELHGATHQAVMEFQVVTAKRLPKIRAGRNLIVFYYRKEMEAVASGIEERKTDTGMMKVAGPALTALDLLRYPRAAGGIDNVVTVLLDLAPKIDPQQLASLSRSAERPVVQRLGHLLDRAGQAAPAQALHDALRARAPAWVELDPREARDPDFAPPEHERDSRWHVIVRRVPEPDE
jgi:predicted transcriptional regulator of viral defense system